MRRLNQFIDIGWYSSSAVRKKIPDRTLIVDYRIISDLRHINLGGRKEDCYPVEVVGLSDMASRILKLTRLFPTTHFLMAKRDISSAFRRILLRPDSIHIFTADIPGSASGRTTDVFFGHLPMPFGWVASPAYFKLINDAISALHNYYRPQQSLMSGAGRFNSFTYVEDCMMIECPLGKRLSSCASFLEWRCREILDDDATNEEKGNWKDNGRIMPL